MALSIDRTERDQSDVSRVEHDDSFDTGIESPEVSSFAVSEHLFNTSKPEKLLSPGHEFAMQKSHSVLWTHSGRSRMRRALRHLLSRLRRRVVLRNDPEKVFNGKKAPGYMEENPTSNSTTSTSELSTKSSNKRRSNSPDFFQTNGTGNNTNFAHEGSSSSPHTIGIQPSLIEQGIATFRSVSLRRPKNTSRIQLLDESWEDWLEKYQRGDQNLSGVGRPTSFCGFGHMAPPLYRHETARLKAVSRVSDPLLWRHELDWLSRELCSVISDHRLKAATVSLIEKTAQQTLWQTGMGQLFSTVSRDLSLDAHTLLSQDHFALLDCSSDWRTRLNPLVHGPPFIKFYLGVNIFVDRLPVGCIAVCDPYLKAQVMPTLVAQLKRISEQLSEALENNQSRKLNRQHSRIRWGDDYPPSLPEEDDFSKRSSHGPNSETGSILSMSTQNSLSKAFSACSLNGDHVFAGSNARLSQVSTTLQPILCRSVLQPFQVFESLLRCQSIPQAIKKACRMIKHNLGAEVIYLAEIRITQQIGACSHKYNKELVSKLSAENVRLEHVGSANTKTRLVGNCTPSINVDVDDLVSSQVQLISSAIQSDYGIQYCIGSTSEECSGSGMVMPLRRQEPIVDYVLDNPRVVSGGFVMVVHDEHPQRTFSPGDQVFMKKVVRALENILTCYDEVNPGGKY